MKKLLKLVYKIIPFKKEIFQLLKLVSVPSEKVYKHLHFKGVFTVPIDQSRSFKMYHHGYVIENEIFWKGIYHGWEKYSMRIWKDLCEKSTTIFDIGANTGLYSLVAKATKPESNVYAFEPVQRVFNKLSQNIRLNQFNIYAYDKAISDSNGKAIIYDMDTEHILSVSVNKNVSETPERTFEVEIETITLDSFIEENEVKSIDLMKIDVEMHEVEALNGFANYLEKFRPTLLIEILNEQVARGVENIVKKLDYTYFNICEETGVSEVDHLGTSHTFNFLICNDEIARDIRNRYTHQ